MKTVSLPPSPEDVPLLIQELYRIVHQLETIFEGRHFTPDGHLVGSLGEAIASHFYGVELSKASTEGYDGIRDGKLIEVKTTQGDRISLTSCPEHLLVFRLLPSGSFEECFNGPGPLAWALVQKKKLAKNGQRQIGLAALRRLMVSKIDNSQILEPVRPIPCDVMRVKGCSA